MLDHWVITAPQEGGVVWESYSKMTPSFKVKRSDPKVWEEGLKALTKRANKLKHQVQILAIC